MKTLNLIILTALAFLLVSCQTGPDKPHLTSLQLQAIQAREFECSRDTAFNAVMSVFQDLGYIIKSANRDTGFITAASPVTSGVTLWGMKVNDGSMHYTLATAFVEQSGQNKAKVRLNFVEKTEKSNSNGQKFAEDTPIQTPHAYQTVYKRIREAIFIRQSTK